VAERSGVAIACLVAAVAIAASAYLALDLKGNVAFALELRAKRLAALATVATAVAISTVVFQTLTANRILTPQIMGLDALYGFGQTALVFALGGLGYATLDPRLKFAGDAGLMAALALALFLPMLRARLDMTLMLLAGVVIGFLFRSLSSLLARLMNPNDFAIASAAGFANFSVVRGDLLLVGAVVTATGAAIAWRSRHVLDVLALGQDHATGLGLDWRRTVGALIALVSVLVAVSTALVGPVVFLGLVVVALAERIVATRRHAVLLPASALVAITARVGGQAALQHGLGGAGALAMVVEFLGGLLFLGLLIASARR
jgi:iron complex transport system permease protein